MYATDRDVERVGVGGRRAFAEVEAQSAIRCFCAELAQARWPFDAGFNQHLRRSASQARHCGEAFGIG